MKREEYISWDEFFIGVAELASKRSKDPSTQNGACIVDPETNSILSVGYNGLPHGLDDDGFAHYDYWEKPQKYEYVVHAELNAILNAKQDITDCVLYLYSERGYYPCSKGCTQAIIQSGIKEVVLHHAITENTEEYDWKYTKHMLDHASIHIRILNED